MKASGKSCELETPIGSVLSGDRCHRGLYQPSLILLPRLGAYKTDTPYATGAVFRSAVESGVVKYYRNGTLFYTSTKTPSFPLYADAVMCDLNATITNAKMSGAQ